MTIKYDSVIGLPIYAFLLMFNRNIWPNSAPLQDVMLRNLSDLDFDLSRSLKVECDGIIGFLDSSSFSSDSDSNFFSYRLLLGLNICKKKNKKKKRKKSLGVWLRGRNPCIRWMQSSLRHTGRTDDRRRTSFDFMSSTDIVKQS